MNEENWTSKAHEDANQGQYEVARYLLEKALEGESRNYGKDLISRFALAVKDNRGLLHIGTLPLEEQSLFFKAAFYGLVRAHTEVESSLENTRKKIEKLRGGE